MQNQGKNGPWIFEPISMIRIKYNCMTRVILPVGNSLPEISERYGHRRFDKSSKNDAWSDRVLPNIIKNKWLPVFSFFLVIQSFKNWWYIPWASIRANPGDEIDYLMTPSMLEEFFKRPQRNAIGSLFLFWDFCRKTNKGFGLSLSCFWRGGQISSVAQSFHFRNVD